MGVAAGGATLEIQLVADVARLKRDMADMQSAVARATGGVETSFAGAGRASAAAAAQMAAAAQASARSAMGMTAGVAGVGRASALSGHHATNLAFQVQDLSMQMAMAAQSSRPLSMAMMALFQQGTQIQGIGMQAGLSLRQMGVEMLKLVGIIKVYENSELSLAAAQAAAASAAIKSQVDRAAAAVATRQTQIALIQSELAAAQSADLQAAAHMRLVKAYRMLEGDAVRLTTAQRALATAQADAARTAEAASAASRIGLGRMGSILGVAASAALLLGSAFSSVKNEANGTDADLKNFISTLGLTRDEIKKLKDTQVTWGDVTKATFETLANRAGTSGAEISEAFGKAFSWIGDFAKFSISIIIASFAALVQFVGSTARNIGILLVKGIEWGVNGVLELIEGMINKIVGGVNSVSSIFSAMGVELGQLHEVNLGRLEAGGVEWSKPFEESGDRFMQTQREVMQGFDAIGAKADSYRDKRLQQQAAEIIADRNAKKARQARESAADKEIRKLEAQIEGHWRLAEAYRLSDAEAMRAEARLKAEEKAISKKGDVELFYAKELALAVAMRASDAAKEIGNLEAEWGARTKVNAMVESGAISLAEHNRELRIEQALRPLIAAAANAEGDKKRVLLDIMDELRLAHIAVNDAIAKEAALREVAKNRDDISKLQLETELIRASNRERAVRLAQLEAEKFIRDNNIAEEDQAGVIQSAIDRANANETLREGQAEYNIELEATLENLRLIGEQSEVIGQLLADAFGPAGEAIGGIINSLNEWKTTQEEITAWKLDALKEVAKDSKAAQEIENQAAKKSQTAQISAMGQMIGLTKSFFKEKSAGYKMMEAAEKAFAIVQLISTARSVAAGAAKMFASLGPFAFPAVAAMLAVMAALGFRGGSGVSGSVPTSAEDLQAAQGTGTVLGDSGAQSQSIVNSLELLSKNSTKGLDHSGDMVNSLRKIESGIGALTASVARQLQVPGGMFDTESLNLGTTRSVDRAGLSLTGIGVGMALSAGPLGLLIGGILGGVIANVLTEIPIIGGLVKALFGTKKTISLLDQGIQFATQSIESILTDGVMGEVYQTISTQKKKKFLGITTSNKTKVSTETSELDSGIAGQVQLIIGDIFDSVVAAAKILGLDVAASLATFQIEIGKLSFKDMTADEIASALQAVFSKVGDQMAGFAIEGLEAFQQAGEGLYETLMRLAKTYLTVEAALDSIGLSFGAVGFASMEARVALVDLMGGLEEFVSQINYYYENFLSSAEQTSFLQQQVNAAFLAMGVSTPQTIDAFKALVESQDLTTEAGQAMFAQLMAIAPMFYELETAAEQAAAQAKALADQLARQRTQLQIQLLEAQGKSVEALALRRKMELEQMDASLRALQKEVWLVQDVADAKEKLLTAYRRESQELQQTIDKFRQFASDLRDFRDSLFAPDASALSYNQALVKLIAQGALAATGDEGALGGGLRSSAETFLQAAEANASSLADVQRARALVARMVDDAIGGAENQATIAEQQLDQLKDQVGALIDINESVLTVAEAIDRLNALLTVPPPVTGGGGGGGGPRPDRPDRGDRGGRDHVEERLGRMEAAAQQTAISVNKLARTFERADRGGAFAVVTDSDSPLSVQSS